MALATNTYKVHKAVYEREGQGQQGEADPDRSRRSASRSGESDATKRATVIEKYAIGAEGLVTNGKAAAKCPFTRPR